MFNYCDKVILKSEPTVIRYVNYIGACTIAAAVTTTRPYIKDEQAVFQYWELVEPYKMKKHRLGVK